MLPLPQVHKNSQVLGSATIQGLGRLETAVSDWHSLTWSDIQVVSPERKPTIITDIFFHLSISIQYLAGHINNRYIPKPPPQIAVGLAVSCDSFQDSLFHLFVSDDLFTFILCV